MAKAAPKSEHTKVIGGLAFGIYHYTLRDDVTDNVIGQGYHVCCSKEAKAGALGSQDPDQHSRTGFSQPRSDIVAVASAAGDTSPLNENESRVARAVMQQYAKELKTLGISSQMGSPERMASLAFDDETATSMHIVRPSAKNDYPLNHLIDALNKTAIECTRTQPWNIPEQEPDAPAESFAKKIGNQPSYAETKLAAIGDILATSFPGEAHQPARAKATAALMKVALFMPEGRGVTFKAADEFNAEKTRQITNALQENFPGDQHIKARVDAMNVLNKLDIKPAPDPSRSAAGRG
jgi:hypothetical protein